MLGTTCVILAAAGGGGVQASGNITKLVSPPQTLPNTFNGSTNHELYALTCHSTRATPGGKSKLSSKTP